jgi:hypothetical protein
MRQISLRQISLRQVSLRHALIGFAVLMLGGTAYSQDYTSSEYCDPVCIEHGSGRYDCSYHNYAQCYASRMGVGGACVDNPMLSLCRRGPAVVAHSAHHRKHQ